MSETAILQLTGQTKKYGNTWWALCDQFPVAGHGSSRRAAEMSLVVSVRLFHDMLGGKELPALPRVDLDGGIPFEMLTPVVRPMIPNQQHEEEEKG